MWGRDGSGTKNQSLVVGVDSDARFVPQSTHRERSIVSVIGPRDQAGASTPRVARMRSSCREVCFGSAGCPQDENGQEIRQARRMSSGSVPSRGRDNPRLLAFAYRSPTVWRAGIRPFSRGERPNSDDPVTVAQRFGLIIPKLPRSNFEGRCALYVCRDRLVNGYRLRCLSCPHHELGGDTLSMARLRGQGRCGSTQNDVP